MEALCFLKPPYTWLFVVAVEKYEAWLKRVVEGYP